MRACSWAPVAGLAALGGHLLCQPMAPAEAAPLGCPASRVEPVARRYLFNLDGMTAAYRFGQLLSMNSLVLKQDSEKIEASHGVGWGWVGGWGL